MSKLIPLADFAILIRQKICATTSILNNYKFSKYFKKYRPDNKKKPMRCIDLTQDFIDEFIEFITKYRTKLNNVYIREVLERKLLD